MKRFVYVLIGLLAGLLVAGGVAFAATAGGPWDNGAQDIAVAQQNAIVKRLVENQPAPTIAYSVERQNLITRYKTFSDRNKVSYIALTTLTGQIVYTGVVKGKISAVSSELTPSNRMTCADVSDDNSQCATVDVAEPDGSWSTNGQGIFWFDDRGVYHEWNGTYLSADAPFTLTVPPLLTITADPTK